MKKAILFLLVAIMALPAWENTLTDSLPKIIVINGFNASEVRTRKNKKELLADLTDTILYTLQSKLQTDYQFEVKVIPELQSNMSNAKMQNLMSSNQAIKAILVENVDVYFVEGDSKRVENYGSKPDLVTRYDMCTNVLYEFYNVNDAPKPVRQIECEYFTTRSVEDKTFTIHFGPDIVGKKKHTFEPIRKNVQKYLEENF